MIRLFWKGIYILGSRVRCTMKHSLSLFNTVHFISALFSRVIECRRISFSRWLFTLTSTSCCPQFIIDDIGSLHWHLPHSKLSQRHWGAHAHRQKYQALCSCFTNWQKNVDLVSSHLWSISPVCASLHA